MFEIGIDIVEHKKMQEKIDDNFIKRILSNDELEYYNLIKSNKRKLEYISSRFAAKEAIFKAYKCGDGTTSYTDISVLNNPDGSPYVVFQKNNDNIKISISHTDNYSVANVILIKRETTTCKIQSI